MGKDMNRYFTKEKMEIAKKHTETYSSSSAIREMQMQSRRKYHYTAMKITIVLKKMLARRHRKWFSYPLLVRM